MRNNSRFMVFFFAVDDLLNDFHSSLLAITSRDNVDLITTKLKTD